MRLLRFRRLALSLLAMLCAVALAQTSVLRASQGDGRHVTLPEFSLPPVARGPFFRRRGEAVVIDQRSDIARGRNWEGVVTQQPENFWLALQQPAQEIQNPGVGSVIPQRGEPHLPVEARLVGLDPGWCPRQIAGLVPELVRLPGGSVV